MTTEQQRKMLECAAKACGLIVIGYQGDGLLIASDGCRSGYLWEPIKNAIDTAEMCAKLDINTYWWPEYVDCTTQNISCDIPHDGTDEGKEAAWRLSASMVAAKVGGYEDA